MLVPHADRLVPHADRALVVSPSSSPEHAFLAEGEPYAVTWGSAIDQELVHGVLTRTRRRVSLQAGETVTVVAPQAWDGAGPGHWVTTSSPHQAC